MAVQLTSGTKLLFPLTSPPPVAEPEPDPSLIAKVMAYGDRQIAVTIPFPDTIELVAGITNEMLAVPDMSGKPAKSTYQELDADIQASLLEIVQSLPAAINGGVNKALTKATFVIHYDPAHPLNRATVTARRTQGTDFGSWRVRLECSASKVGPAGFVKLIAQLGAVLPFLNVAKLIQAFRVARIDGAIDCIGASPLDLIAHIPKPGKRMVFVGDHGRPESVYFYEGKKQLVEPAKSLSYNTRGTHRLKLYERRDHHLQLKLSPPYGPCPVTRAEVTKRWTKERPPLSELALVKNLFQGRRVAYAPAVPTGKPKAWRRFCLAAFGGGVDRSLFSWLPGSGGKFAKAYRQCAGDLIDESCWDRWTDGIAYTGLSEWIALALDN